MVTRKPFLVQGVSKTLFKRLAPLEALRLFIGFEIITKCYQILFGGQAIQFTHFHTIYGWFSPNYGAKYGPFKQNKVHCWYVLLRLQQPLKKHCTLNKANSYIHLIFRIHKIMNLMGWHIFLNIINIFIWLLNTLQSSQWDGLFTTALLAWYLPQLQARSNHKDDCHIILVPKSQVDSILQCFGLIFILMDRLGALGEASFKKNWFFSEKIQTSETPPPPPYQFGWPNFFC